MPVRLRLRLRLRIPTWTLTQDWRAAPPSSQAIASQVTGVRPQTRTFILTHTSNSQAPSLSTHSTLAFPLPGAPSISVTPLSTRSVFRPASCLSTRERKSCVAHRVHVLIFVHVQQRRHTGTSRYIVIYLWDTDLTASRTFSWTPHISRCPTIALRSLVGPRSSAETAILDQQPQNVLALWRV